MLTTLHRLGITLDNSMARTRPLTRWLFLGITPLVTIFLVAVLASVVLSGHPTLMRLATLGGTMLVGLPWISWTTGELYEDNARLLAFIVLIGGIWALAGGAMVGLGSLGGVVGLASGLTFMHPISPLCDRFRVDRMPWIKE